MNLGAHLSIAGGVENAIAQAGAWEFTAVAIFLRNQRQWDAPPLDQATVKRFRAARRKHGITSVIAHASYLVNLAGEDAVRGPKLLLETTAGQGTSLGWRFEQLAEILRLARRRGRCGVCLDTCHVFAAGHDLRTAAGYAAMMAEFDRTVGLARLAPVCRW